MDLPDKITGDQYLATEFTEFKNELINLILASGQTATSNSIQIKQAVARMASNGATHTENGSVNALNLVAIGTNDIITAYRDGDMFTFIAGTSNTGSATLKIQGLTAKSVKINGFADNVASGDIIAGRVYSALYSLSNDAFELIALSNLRGPFDGSNGTVLTTIDMTNGGANDLNVISVTWQSAWDSYDYVKIIISNGVTSNQGQIGFVIASTGTPSTYLQLLGVTSEALSWTNGSVNKFSGDCELALQSRTKQIIFNSFGFGAGSYKVGSPGNKGMRMDYNGTSLSGSNDCTDWNSWDTNNSFGLDGFILSFVHDVGNFTNGTLKIIGYNYPS